MLCDLDWGVEGVERAVARDDVLVIVDTLSFCSAVITAVEQGAMVYPCYDPEQAASIAEREGATTTVPQRDVSAGQPYSLSPVAYQHIEPGTRLVLASRNGASCLQPASEAEQVYLGCLLNAEAAASHVAGVAEEKGKNITLIAVGERSSDHGLPGADRLLFAIEDYLACGAILCGIMADHTAEATVCANAFLQSQGHLRYLLEQSLSGQRLTAQGVGEDVTYSAQLNLCNRVPQFR